MQGLNLEQLSSTRTVPQEHAALKSAITAERLVQQLLPVIEQGAHCFNAANILRRFDSNYRCQNNNT